MAAPHVERGHQQGAQHHAPGVATEDHQFLRAAQAEPQRPKPLEHEQDRA
jgi:hypothetical protein